MFEFMEGRDPDKIAYLQWSPFAESTTYFEPSDKDFILKASGFVKGEYIGFQFGGVQPAFSLSLKHNIQSFEPIYNHEK
ncbi:MAG: hypothetical protein U5Q03_08475 [Bacteroidota bacterium]|nr:hypothetical protein [Bacteroidota bacterium]